MSYNKIYAKFAVLWTGINQRIKQLSTGAGVGCGEQALSSEREA